MAHLFITLARLDPQKNARADAGPSAPVAGERDRDSQAERRSGDSVGGVSDQSQPGNKTFTHEIMNDKTRESGREIRPAGEL
jgi:hypothetical protein